MNKGLRFAVVGLVAVATAGVAMHVLHPSAKAADGGLLTGMVKSASGEKMAGVTVSAKADGATITTSVYTDADGSFYFPRMADGKYEVRAQAVGFDGSKSDVDLSGAVQHQNFTLKTIDDFSRQLTGDQWMAALPEDTREDKRMKEIIRLDCTGCHSPAFPLQNKFDEKGWTAMLNLMSRMIGSGRPPMAPDQPPMPVVNYFKPEFAAYLAKMRGPGPSPMKFKARPRPTGESALAVVTEYDVPLPEGGYPDHNGSDWSFGTPGKSADVHDAQIDFNGNLWFTDWTPNMVRTLGRIDGKTGKETDIRVEGQNGYAAATHAIVRDANGIIWFNCKVQEGGNSGRLVRLDPSTGNYELFKPPDNIPTVGDFLDWDGKGKIWVAAGAGETRLGILRFDPDTKTFTYFKAPWGEGVGDGHSGLYGVAADSQGNGWYSLYSANMEARADNETGKTLGIDLPKRPDNGLFTAEEKKVFALEGGNAFFWGQPWAQGPRRPGADKRGNVVWVPGWFSHSLMKIDINTAKVIAQYPMPRVDAGPYMAQVDKNHIVWINYQNSGTVSKFDPATEKWTEYMLPSLGLETHQIGVYDHGDGPTQIVVADERNSKLAKLTLRSQGEVNSLKAEVEKDSQRITASK